MYLASISTICRILAENRQVRERRRLARHPARKVPELIATAPGQVLSWDITKLVGPIKGKYFDCCVMIDIFSRYIVGAVVHASESAVLAAEMMRTYVRDSWDPAGRSRASGAVDDEQDRRGVVVGFGGHMRLTPELA